MTDPIPVPHAGGAAAADVLLLHASRFGQSIAIAEALAGRLAEAGLRGEPVSYTHLTLPTTPYV